MELPKTETPTIVDADEDIDGIEMVTICNSDGIIYSEGPIPMYAEAWYIIQERCRVLQETEFERHIEQHGHVVPFKPRFVHGLNLATLYKVELSSSKRPRIGRQPERIMHQCYQCESDVDGEFRDRMCTKCKTINKEAREKKKANLTNFVALVTGGRIKIGYAVCLKLLRSGATVITTTRFPQTTIKKYKEEKDSNDWMNRLHVYGLDLRCIPALINLLKEIEKKFRRMDIIVNNAAQTVRRPPAYYHQLFEEEQCTKSSPFPNPKTSSNTTQLTNLLDSKISLGIDGKWAPWATQVPVLPGDQFFRDDKLFPLNEKRWAW